ncbi:MAG: D-amino-acid transaminase [Alphaproteobacteria bacterium]|nr:D-amino-acid transaminase [Alphaproteobacteria bacterium]
MRISYVNGRFLPHSEASVHIEDRGYQFSDGVYEVMAVVNGAFLDGDWHLARLRYSLEQLEIAPPVAWTAFPILVRELLRRNKARDGMVYIQATRGVAKRDHAFPKNTRPSLVMTVVQPKWPSAAMMEKGVPIITAPDVRWGRRDIKSISLLPNILAKQAAARAGVREAWLVGEDGVVTEGSSTNAWIIDAKGKVVTHPANHRILGGITRLTLIQLAKEAGIPVVEKPFTVSDLRKASEAFLTSTTSLVLPVVVADGKKIGKGVVGPVTKKLQQLYADYISGL